MEFTDRVCNESDHDFNIEREDVENDNLMNLWIATVDFIPFWKSPRAIVAYDDSGFEVELSEDELREVEAMMAELDVLAEPA